MALCCRFSRRRRGDPLGLVLIALLTIGGAVLPAGIIAFAAGRWQPGLVILLTHGAISARHRSCR
ncbi:hypothetical protein [Arthrobacter sp. Marseille-P9274]|uniref:hypothetical protein n=1 Tax=Arthrobacter sp. Marseille-P9274 TaxID=2866572 RepID=UPI0021CA8304|nr:hypothetical protein [Arthrobacter sp. Marseille-P9274]